MILQDYSSLLSFVARATHLNKSDTSQGLRDLLAQVKTTIAANPIRRIVEQVFHSLDLVKADSSPAALKRVFHLLKTLVPGHSLNKAISQLIEANELKVMETGELDWLFLPSVKPDLVEELLPLIKNSADNARTVRKLVEILKASTSSDILITLRRLKALVSLNFMFQLAQCDRVSMSEVVSLLETCSTPEKLVQSISKLLELKKGQTVVETLACYKALHDQ